MRRTAPAMAVLALCASLTSACERKRKGQPPPAAKPISPAVVEPLPAPRGQPKIPRTPPAPKDSETPADDAGTETETETDRETGER